ncbi:MAG: glycoside hydrolase family 32 protein [Niabella sp.]
MFNRKYMPGICVILWSTFLGACNKNAVSFNQEDLTNPVSFFPAPPSAWLNAQGTTYYSSGYVGDVMPYFANDSFHVFYLHDGDANGGYHPVHAFTTSDLLHYNYQGRMIPFGSDSDQDRAIGTGSIIKEGSTYYFFYTGHNDLYWSTGDPVEGIMYATSTDLVNWTKHTDFVMYPSTTDGYGANDFRDPYVFYNDEAGEYWMLVSAYQNSVPVIALYTTTDISSNNWTLKDPFYTTDNTAYGVMECPDVFKMGSYWYLVFSETGVNNTTHYRMASSLSGPWTTPETDVFDGAFYYAAKTASDGTNRYLFGWVYRKDGATDYGSNIWAGNLVTHQLVQNSDGTLSVKIPEAISNLLSKNKTFTQDSSTNASVSGSTYSLQANGFAGFGLINGQKKITTTIKDLQTGGDAGFAFGYARSGSSDYYKLRFKDGIVYLLKVQGTDEYIDCKIPFNFASGNDVKIELIVDNSILTVNINGTINLTGRIYWLPNAKWGVYSVQDNVIFQDLKISEY